MLSWIVSKKAARFPTLIEGNTMHQHQQTLADLEREAAPSAAECAAYLAVMLAAVACVTLFFFTV